jgi:Tfp pilus assembly protein PilN
MIEINLLPEALRKAEGTPLPRFVAMCAGIVVNGILLVLLLHLVINVLRDTQERHDKLAKEVSERKEEAKKLDDLQLQIAQINARVDAVRTLYQNRTVFAKILWDLKQIIDYDERINESNPEGRYLWLTSLKYQVGKTLDIEGLASGANTTEASKNFEELLRQINTYRCEKAPEELERKDLEERRTRVKVEMATAKARAASPEEADVQEYQKQLDEIEKRLQEIQKAVPSGGVAKLSFLEFFKSLQWKGISWQTIASAEKTEKGAKAENMPFGAQKFLLTLDLKPPEVEEPLKKKTPGKK